MRFLRLFGFAFAVAAALIVVLPHLAPEREEAPAPVAASDPVEPSASVEVAATEPETSPLTETVFEAVEVEAGVPVVPEVAVAEVPDAPIDPAPVAEAPALAAEPAAIMPESVAEGALLSAYEPEIAAAPVEPESGAGEASARPAGPMTRAEIAASPPSELSPHGFLSDVYSFGRNDEISEEQREAVTRGIIGKMVEWELTLFNTSEGDEGDVILMSAGADQAEVFCRISETSDDEMAAIRRLAPGDRFTCKGPIAGTFIRNLVIEPAIVMTGAPGS